MNLRSHKTCSISSVATPLSDQNAGGLPENSREPFLKLLMIISRSFFHHQKRHPPRNVNFSLKLTGQVWPNASCIFAGRSNLLNSDAVNVSVDVQNIHIILRWDGHLILCMFTKLFQYHFLRIAQTCHKYNLRGWKSSFALELGSFDLHLLKVFFIFPLFNPPCGYDFYFFQVTQALVCLR